MTTKPTKVLLLFWGSRGGGSIFTYYLAEHLRAEADIDLCVSLRESNDDLALLSEAGIAVKTLEFASLRQLLLSPWKVLQALHRHIKALNAWRPEVTIVTMNGPFAWPYVGVLKAAGSRIVYVAHDARPHPGDYARTWQRLTQARLLQLSDLVVTLSRHVAGEILRERPGLAVRNVALDAVYPERQSARRLPIQGGVVRFLVLGRLIRYKGFDVLRDALMRLGQERWSLTIAGHGPLRDEIESQFSAIPNVHLELEWLTDQRMYELLASHDVLVCNYSEASQSGLIAQALSCGVPVIATNRGALPEQLGHSAGVLTDGTAEDLARKMQELLAEPDRLGEMTIAAKKLFAENKKACAWTEIVRSLVAKRHDDEVISSH